MFILTKRSRKGGIIVNQIIFDDENAHVKSRAAYVLLRDKLIVQDEDYIERRKPLEDWLNAREIFLTRRQNENGGNLVCDYCGKEHLDIGGKAPKDLIQNNKNKNLATVDHIQPLFEEGEKFNEDNMCVSCKKCNLDKATKSLEEFLNSLPKEKFEKTASFLIEMAKGKLNENIEEDCIVMYGEEIKLPKLQDKIKNLNTNRLLAYYKSERKNHFKLTASKELYDEFVEPTKEESEELDKGWRNLFAIKKELDKREHIA